MPRTETIMTRTVTKGKGGTRVSKEKYEAFRKAILKVVPKTKSGIAFKELPRKVEPLIPSDMLNTKGSCSWYTTTIKLDLEARGLIERVPGVSPQRLRRCK